MPQIEAVDSHGQTPTVQFDHEPDTCPRCHHAIDPKLILSAGLLTRSLSVDAAMLELVFRCPRHDCSEVFIACYQRFNSHRPGHQEFKFRWTAPMRHREPSLPAEIGAVSSEFKLIFSQAAHAEELGLDQIAGCGYRKALEFLIKDYCILMQPQDAGVIRQEFLATVVKNRVSDPNVKECASRAAWLGNDESHYERRWQEKDIKDLKTLIQLTIHWIMNSVLTKQYISEMPDPSSHKNL